MAPKTKEVTKAIVEQIDEAKYEEAYRTFTFNDNAGNLVTIKPWSMTKWKVGSKIVADIMDDVRKTTESLDFLYFFSMHMDYFFKNHIEKVCDILLLTTDKDAKWLDSIDAPMALAALHAVWQQNFIGERMMDQVGRFVSLVPASPAVSQPAAEADLPIPGLT